VVERSETTRSSQGETGAQIGQEGQATALGISFVVSPEPYAIVWDPSPYLSHPVGVVPTKEIPCGARGRA
jgi:hypothetical protein